MNFFLPKTTSHTLKAVQTFKVLLPAVLFTLKYNLADSTHLLQTRSKLLNNLHALFKGDLIILAELEIVSVTFNKLYHRLFNWFNSA